MAITVHDGTAAAVYDSFLSDADALAYHALRGNDAWGATVQAEREAALVKATDFLNSSYAIAITDGVDARIERATAELALFALTGSLVDTGTREITEETKSLSGVVSKAVKYRNTSDRFPLITTMLAPVAKRLTGTVSTAKVVR